ncbi:MAG: sensor histidine kinase, partial [Pseudomonadota bacterium]|nr:sensor histidine kinase [Pseudomonadota bacterium]
ILTSVLLPIGFGLGFVAYNDIRQANAALKIQSEERARTAARGVESLIARNALALRIAANGRISVPGIDPCARARQSLAIAPAVAQRFMLHSDDGSSVCAVGDLGETGPLSLIAPGDIQLRVAPTDEVVIIRVGVVGGIATTALPASEIRAAAAGEGDFDALIIKDGVREIEIVASREPLARGEDRSTTSWPIGNGRLFVELQGRVPAVTTIDRLVILLPVVMWFIAALITWLVVTRLLIQPLRRLQRAVGNYQPGDAALELPQNVGPATEIQELRDAFGRAVSRVEESEQEMGAALDGQRRLVREVHHRVKNNLQVVASLLNIHGRTAENEAARAAYASIGRRVGALAVVHRNHFAEMEENRGIALRPLLSELVAELRASAPQSARGLTIEMDLEGVHTTQDAAVSVAFLVTEVVEFAMLNRPDEPVEVALRRCGDLSGRLTLSSAVLVPEAQDAPEKVQFERIIGGLAKQLRSTLDRKLGRYSVDLPIFPARV